MTRAALRLLVHPAPDRGPDRAARTVFGASGTRSTIIQSGMIITVTLGTRNSGAVLTSLSLTPMVWTPSSQATDRAGNPCSTAPVTESGLGDPVF